MREVLQEETCMGKNARDLDQVSSPDRVWISLAETVWGVQVCVWEEIAEGVNEIE